MTHPPDHTSRTRAPLSHYPRALQGDLAQHLQSESDTESEIPYASTMENKCDILTLRQLAQSINVHFMNLCFSRELDAVILKIQREFDVYTEQIDLDEEKKDRLF